MSEGMVPYEVRRGDTLGKIARRFGLPSWRALYDHDANEAFRERRPNPNLIMPGDVVRVPARHCDATAPGARVEFPLSAASPFHALVRRHDDERPRLETWRAMVRDHAGALAAALAGYPDRSIAATTFRDAFLARPPAGDRQVFDPWNGFWGGRWQPGNSRQCHVWDVTQAYEGAWVQPVTQSVSGFKTADDLPAALGCEARTTVDLAINVWSPSLGVTGWVSKRQDTAQELPHIGYRIDARTLVWITRILPCPMPDGAGEGPFLMFLEWASEDRSVYRIRGKRFRITAAGEVELLDNGALVGRGDYAKRAEVPCPGTVPACD